MGVPKLFKYLTDRYPSLSKTVGADQVHFRHRFCIQCEYFFNYKFCVCVFQLPQYDYLYIDINFLIHKAATEQGLLPLEELDHEFSSEPRIFERIFSYIQTLHRIIPCKVLFLAIDGVAPRAKWPTQRERRYFRSFLFIFANLIFVMVHRMRAVGKQIDSQTAFDATSISPGTAFMHSLETVLLEFVSNQIKSQQNWQNCEVFISGSSVRHFFL